MFRLIEMKTSISIIIVLAFSLPSCKEREPVITIVDIGNSNRLEIGKQLSIISRHSPRLVGLDFFLTYDSLDHDNTLVRELGKLANTVQVVGLHHYIDLLDQWDSLEVSNSKFKISNHGFSNVMTLEDEKIFVQELPMSQRVYDSTVYSFSYVVADNSFGVKSRYKGRGTEKIDLDIDDFGEGIRIIKSKDLVAGNFRREDFDGKIVLLGYVGPNEDFFYVDDEKIEKVNGVIIQAAIINEILDLK